VQHAGREAQEREVRLSVDRNLQKEEIKINIYNSFFSNKQRIVFRHESKTYILRINVQHFCSSAFTTKKVKEIGVINQFSYSLKLQT